MIQLPAQALCEWLPLLPQRPWRVSCSQLQRQRGHARRVLSTAARMPTYSGLHLP